jgi:hypothetical protein
MPIIKNTKQSVYYKYHIPYSAKVKPPMGLTLGPALDAKISSHIELNFGTPRYDINYFNHKIKIINLD